MRYTPPGRLKTVEAFRDAVAALDLDIACVDTIDDAADVLARPIDLLGRTLSNRFAIHPMEGWDGERDGTPGPLTERRWERFGRSGAGLIWGGEAFAVCAEGRANPRQLFLNDDIDMTAALTGLRETVRRGRRAVGLDPDDAVIGLQLTHSGRFCRPDATGPRPLIVHRHAGLASKFGLADDHALLSDDALRAIRDRFVDAARVAGRAGFDFVDVKCAHGYLLHEALAARTRDGMYGGSFENRTRLVREIVEGIRTECPRLAIGVRLSATDLPPYARTSGGAVGAPLDFTVPYRDGFGVREDDPTAIDLDEPLRLLHDLVALDVTLINVTVGSPYYCPHVQRPATYPPSDGYLPPDDPLCGVALHLDVTREIKRALPLPVVVGSGYSYLQEYLPHVAAREIAAGHVDFAGLGRMVLAYPELPDDVVRRRTLDARRLCRTFSECTTGPRHGMVSGCFPLDPFYKKRPEAQQIRILRRDAGRAAT